MRLLIDCHCFDDGESQGINTYIRELYKALIPMVKDITFIFAAQNIHKIKSIFGDINNVEYLQLGNHNKYYRLAIEYPKLIRNNKIDFAHFQYTSPLIKNCKTIVTLHDILFEDFPLEFPISYRISKHLLFKISAKKADILLTVSDYSKNRIVQKYNIPESMVFVTHNGVNKDFYCIDKSKAVDIIYNKYGIRDYILYVSRFEPRKNQQALLRAYKSMNLNKRGYELVFIGVKSLACDAFDTELSTCDDEMTKHIHCLQDIPYEELKNWYAGASLFVYPSKAEGFGIPPLEAAASLIPTICNNQTAMSDFDFFSPYHIDTSNQQNLEAIIESILSEVPSENFLKEIQSHVYIRYSWDKIASDYYTILKSCL